MNVILKSVLIVSILWLITSLLLCCILCYIYEWENFFAWYDFWVGIYYDRHKRIIYVIPFPCFVYSFDRNKRKRKKKKNVENNNVENTQVENELSENIDSKY